MKNIKFILIIAIFGVFSNMITAKLCEIRIKKVQEEVDGIQYDMNTLEEVIKEILK